MSTREARLSDAPTIARIHVDAWQTAYRGLLPDTVLDALSVADRTADWERRLRAGAPGRHWVVERGGVAGWASIGPCRDPDQPPGARELYAIYLDPAHWRAGVGTELYRRAEAAAARYSPPEIVLWVMEANERARAFYTRMGFVPEGARRVDDQGVDTVRLVKALR